MTKKTLIIVSSIFIVLSILLGCSAFYFLTEFYPNVFSKPNWMQKIISSNKENYKILNAFQQGDAAKEVICDNCVRRNIDGVYVENGQENFYPIAVIIENHTDARPLSGLSQANLVFEAEAEGGITRFLAVFANGKDVQEIGPVRSARPYFVDWAQELSALFIHCGGSPEALVKIVKDNVLSLNEFYNSDFYWRDNGKLAPHNIYTSTEKTDKYLRGRSLTEGKYLTWQFKDDEPILDNEIGANITINFKTSDYLVNWNYDKENNDYIRYQAGEKHKTNSDKEIRAKNVITQFVKAEVIDEELRLKMEYIGSDKAIICMDGKCEKGEWRKKTNKSRTRFYNENGEEFKFNAGTTWVEVVRPE